MKALSLLFTLALALSARGSEDYKAATFEGSTGVLPYRILSPSAPAAEEKYPLVIVLHGAGERGDDNVKQLTHGGAIFTKVENREKYPAFIVFPQCPMDKRWVEVDWSEPEPHLQPEEPSQPMSLVMELIPTLVRTLPVERRRIHVMGLSMGGFGTWDLLARHPEWFASAVPICGGADNSTAPVISKLPVWTFHGDRDGTIRVERTRSMVEALKKAGGAPKYTELPGTGHDAWSPAFGNPELLPWMFAQKRQ